MRNYQIRKFLTFDRAKNREKDYFATSEIAILQIKLFLNWFNTSEQIVNNQSTISLSLLRYSNMSKNAFSYFTPPLKSQMVYR